MPLYEYQCQDCHQIFEVIQKISDPDPEKCQFCGGSVERLLSAPAIRFKGSGWYVNDYGKPNGDGSKEKESKPTPKEKKTESSKSSEKPATSGKGSKVA